MKESVYGKDGKIESIENIVKEAVLTVKQYMTKGSKSLICLDNSDSCSDFQV